MEKLKKQYNRNRNTYVQLEECENHYIYGVWSLKDIPEGAPSYYEVFRRKALKAETINGHAYPEREAYPSDKDFGVWAWCCSTLERANRIKTEKCLF